MKTSNDQNNNYTGRKAGRIVGGILAGAVLAGAVFFFAYYRVTDVQVMGATHYTEEEVKTMALRGAMMGNTVLAVHLHPYVEADDVPFVEGFTITKLNHHAICVNVREKQIVGCIPYLDSYVYFDRNGIFVESSKVREKNIPYFDGIQINKIVRGEKLPIKGSTVLTTAVALVSIFEKNDKIPDHIQFDDNYQISLVYGDITVMLGEDRYLEDKMSRVFAILPTIAKEKGILHLENVTETVKTITFEREDVEITAENWNGGYDENGDYTGDGEYDENGKYVGPKPKTELDYALENWPGGYDEEGDYTGEGEYDADWNYVGPKPTAESIAANGDWHGGYTEYGEYNGSGEYDHDGNYVGPNPKAVSDEDDSEESYDYEYYEDDYDDYYEEDYSDEDWE